MTTRPPTPVLPAHLRREFALLDRAEAIPFETRPDLMTGGLLLIAEALEIRLRRTPEEVAAEEEYDRQVEAWNAYARAERDARWAEAETVRVRAATCPSCFTIHAGSECY